MSDEPQRNDDAFLQMAGMVITKAQETGDLRLIKLVEVINGQLIESDLLPTLLLRYHLLSKQEEQLELPTNPRK